MYKILFVGFTPYHLINSIYYAAKIKEKCKDCSSILIWHDYADYKVDLSMFSDLFLDIYVIPSNVNLLDKQFKKMYYTGFGFCFSPVGKFINNIDEKIFLFCFSDAHELTFKIIKKVLNKKNTIVLVDEGLGTYEMNFRKMPTKTRVVNFLLGIKRGDYIGSNKNIDAVILKHPEWVKGKKFLECDVLKQSNIFSDPKLIEMFNSIKKEIAPYLNDGRKFLLWLGDPVEECGGNKLEEIRLIEKVAKYLQDTHFILIKAHPREKRKFYKEIGARNVGLLDLPSFNWIPIEIIVAYLKFETVITVISSAAFNIYQLKSKIQVIYAYNLIGGLIFDRTIMEGVLKNDNVYCPMSIEEVVKFINKENQISEKEFVKSEEQDIQYIIQKINESEK